MFWLLIHVHSLFLCCYMYNMDTTQENAHGLQQTVFLLSRFIMSVCSGFYSFLLVFVPNAFAVFAWLWSIFEKSPKKPQQCLLLALVEISDHALNFKVFFFPFKKTLFLRAILHSQQNRGESIESSHVVHVPKQTAFSTISLLNQSGTFVTTDEPTVTKHHQPKSVIHFRVHSWRFALYELGKMFNDMYSSL